MIIWLASYPKSGNTWVRLFLNHLLYSKDKNLNINNIHIDQFPTKKHFLNINVDIVNTETFVENCIKAQEYLNLDNKIKFFKTHHAYWKTNNQMFTDENNSMGCIYIARDPRNIITSLKNHYFFETYKQALEFLKNEKQIIGLKNSQKNEDVPHILSSWKNHFNSWKKFKKNYLLIKYENLIENKDNEFFKITKFLEEITNLRFKNDHILKSIKLCNFNNLKNQEDIFGFSEAAVKKNGEKANFFHLGPDNIWQKLLNNEIRKELEKNFENEMKELGYL